MKLVELTAVGLDGDPSKRDEIALNPASVLYVRAWNKIADVDTTRLALRDSDTTSIRVLGRYGEVVGRIDDAMAHADGAGSAHAWDDC